MQNRRRISMRSVISGDKKDNVYYYSSSPVGLLFLSRSTANSKCYCNYPLARGSRFCSSGSVSGSILFDLHGRLVHSSTSRPVKYKLIRLKSYSILSILIINVQNPLNFEKKKKHIYLTYLPNVSIRF